MSIIIHLRCVFGQILVSILKATVVAEKDQGKLGSQKWSHLQCHVISLSSIGGGTWIEHELLMWSSHYVKAPCQHVEVFKQLLNMKNIVVVVLDMNPKPTLAQ